MTNLPRLLVAAGALALVGACTSSAGGFCEAHADCDQIIGQPLASILLFGDPSGDADDSVDVCTANQNGIVRALRTNEEEECQVAADKRELYMACIASEFADDPDGCDVLGSKCEDELDDLFDAVDDIDGNECNSNED